MDMHHWYQPLVLKVAWVGGTLSALASSLYAFAVAPDNGAAASAVSVGIGGMVVAALGVIVQLTRIIADDRRNARETSSDSRILRERVAALEATVQWFRSNSRPTFDHLEGEIKP